MIASSLQMRKPQTWRNNQQSHSAPRPPLPGRLPHLLGPAAATTGCLAESYHLSLKQDSSGHRKGCRLQASQASISPTLSIGLDAWLSRGNPFWAASWSPPQHPHPAVFYIEYHLRVHWATGELWKSMGRGVVCEVHTIGLTPGLGVGAGSSLGARGQD
uniref:platelet glycoprotein IX isoform X2 n=1 Tax=Halichoerus grypus TaxID=9711 RepID=UPI0016593347|nr:platelet glycoprotein IX isoform X2 [Halichoerus grypus]